MTEIKTELDQLADRHFRDDPQGVLGPASAVTHAVVLVQVSETMSMTYGIQHLAWMCVSLLARQFKVVREIVLDIPSTALLPGIAPFGAMPSLAESLRQCVLLIAGPHVLCRYATASDKPDVALIIGGGNTNVPNAWHLYADGWRFALSNKPNLPQAPPISALSIGPYMCASQAAGEVFKLLRGMKPGKGKFVQEHLASVWDISTASSWEELAEGPNADALGVLPHFYFAGAGAVAQAAALCLGSSGFRGSCSVVDRDMLDLTNDNRYCLSTREDDGVSKVDIMRKYLQAHGFKTQAIPLWWQEFVTSGGRNAFDDEVKTLECSYMFPIVLSCVDKNEARHAVQNTLPRLIISGSTDGLTAKSSVFDLSADAGCLKCYNPLQSRNALIKDRVESLRIVDGEERAQLASKLGLSSEDVELLLRPAGCGILSEADLTRFAAATPEMSVGFVSAAAGVMMVGRLLKHIYSTSTSDSRKMAVATYAQASMRYVSVGRDATCDCTSGARRRWASMWTLSEGKSLVVAP